MNDWSDIDWTQAQEIIPGLFGVNLRKRKVGSRSNSVWAQRLDWTKPDRQIMAETGRVLQSVLRWRMRLNPPESPLHKMPRYQSDVVKERKIALRQEYTKLDWSLQDIVLAKKTGLSRERMRQLRRILGMPEPINKFKQTECSSVFKKRQVRDMILRQNAERYSKMTIKQISAELGLRPDTTCRIFKNLKLKTVSVSRPTRIHLVNWSLPDLTIKEIWHLTHVSERRAYSGSKKSKFKRWKLCLNAGPLSEYERLVAEECEKAKANGFDPINNKLVAREKGGE